MGNVQVVDVLPDAVSTPLYELALEHAERFEHMYDERYAPQYGLWRPRVGKTLMQCLDCGVPSSGMMRVGCANMDIASHGGFQLHLDKML